MSSNLTGRATLLGSSPDTWVKTDKPNIVVNFFDADGLAGKDRAEVNRSSVTYGFGSGIFVSVSDFADTALGASVDE